MSVFSTFIKEIPEILKEKSVNIKRLEDLNIEYSLVWHGAKIL